LKSFEAYLLLRQTQIRRANSEKSFIAKSLAPLGDFCLPAAPILWLRQKTACLRHFA
jgi:hypothetical protein